jgi:hypothetical protein
MDLFNINSPKFLGGQNVHSLIKIGLATFVVYKLVKRG